jgi:hypothetical protein
MLPSKEGFHVMAMWPSYLGVCGMTLIQLNMLIDAAVQAERYNVVEYLCAKYVGKSIEALGYPF